MTLRVGSHSRSPRSAIRDSVRCRTPNRTYAHAGTRPIRVWSSTTREISQRSVANIRPPHTCHCAAFQSSPPRCPELDSNTVALEIAIETRARQFSAGANHLGPWAHDERTSIDIGSDQYRRIL